MKGFFGFWSYSHVDDHEGILSWLREQLVSELYQQSGQLREIFQDVKDLKIGQSWKPALKHGLQNADFLVPIITPSFMNSKACREEVKHFRQQEQDEGTPDLILPIYWTRTDSISDERVRSTDPLAEEITNRQWDDWRKHRNLPPRDPKWRPLITKLAEDMLSRYKDRSLQSLAGAKIVGKIQWPEDGDRVFREVQVKGSINGLPSNCELWIGVLTGRSLHPQAQIVDTAGRWSSKVRIGSGGVNKSTGETFPVQILTVTEETGNRFRTYLSEAAAAKNWQGIKPQSGSRRIDEIKVIRDDQAASGSLAGSYAEYTQGPTGATVTMTATANPNGFLTTANGPGGKGWHGTLTVDEHMPDQAKGTYGSKPGVIDGEHTFTINRTKGEIIVSGKTKNGHVFKTTWRRK